jgi:prepilin-type N-terminal cleavage/methylation domain-containing protein
MRINRKSAFTLVELLVVILIIGILVGILIPVVNSVRRKGQAAATLAQINALRGAIEAYQGTYNAYPGPIPDHYMYQLPPGTPPMPTNINGATGGSQVTMTENMVLGIMGGLENLSGQVSFNPANVGNGPRSLNPANPAQHQAFYSNSNELDKGFFSDRVDNAGKPIPSCFDTDIPEFVDKFNEPMPILYLRARRGAKGVMSDAKNYNAQNPDQLFQYDVRQYYSYICDPSSGNPSSGIVIGGRKQQGARGNFWDLASGSPQSGVGDPAQGGNGDPLLNGKDQVNFAIAYFRDPSTSIGAINNDQASPRNKDGFILISAGPDRLFGTADDLVSFGSVIP